MRRPTLRRRLALTPLIDVIFLLLLFFMLSSTFTRFGEVELIGQPRPQGSSPATGAMAFLRLEEAGVSLNGQPIGLAALPDHLNQQPEARLLLSLGPSVTAQRLTDLMVVLEAVPDLRLTVLEGQ